MKVVGIVHVYIRVGMRNVSSGHIFINHTQINILIFFCLKFHSLQDLKKK